MGRPQVPIEVDDTTGEWSVDGVPMILVPRHFFLNNHLAIERALGEESYAELLFDAGHRSAYQWCDMEAKTHGFQGLEVFHHYMRRLSQRGWGLFQVQSVDAETGHARIHVFNSVFTFGKKPAKACYMFRGWFCGSLEYAAGVKLVSDELQCAAEGHQHCVFETRLL